MTASNPGDNFSYYPGGSFTFVQPAPAATTPRYEPITLGRLATSITGITTTLHTILGKLDSIDTRLSNLEDAMGYAPGGHAMLEAAEHFESAAAAAPTSVVAAEEEEEGSDSERNKDKPVKKRKSD
jgi:hypothetical protein